jgi:hypothetical protein
MLVPKQDRQGSSASDSRRARIIFAPGGVA